MRGKGGKTLDAVDLIGSTPAYAGKRRSSERDHRGAQDHPRLCGEKSSGLPRTWTIWGSPPPMRGKGLGDYSRKDGYGITPAYAGKSFAEWIDEQGEEDHPRLCGEKYCRIPQQQQDIGSPPPMRGKGLVCGDPCVNHRITPAYAGKRVSSILLHSTL